MSVLAWLFGSRTGRELLAAGVLALAAHALYHRIVATAFSRGQADVQQHWDAAKADARRQAARFASSQARAGADLAADTAKKSDAAHAQVTKTVTETHEVIRYVYRDRPVTPPAGALACLRPLDGRVQRRIELGVDQARSSAR